MIGILSDSHGRHLAVRQAMQLFDEHGVEHVVHCGDVGGIPVFDEMLGRPLTFVFGNMDFPDTPLYAYLEAAGLKAVDGKSPVVRLGGKSLAVFHGHETGFAKAVDDLAVDYLLHGHTHVMCDERRRTTRMINPGALHRARVKTVAMLETTADRLSFHELAV